MKNNYFKHLFTALLLLCSTVVAAHDFEVDGIYYNITYATNKTVKVTYRGNNTSDYLNEYTGSVVIPENVNYDGITYRVTSIGSGAFYGCSGLTSIVIPNSVTSIGDYAFYSCSGLTSVTIPNSVTSIGNQAFYNCSGLTSVTIPNSVTSIGNQAFAYCSGLTSIIVGIGNMYYDSRDICNAIIETATNTLLAGCQNTIIPNDVTSIGDYAFYNCSGLTSVTIPNSVTSIGNQAFYNCSGLTSIVIPNSVTSIGELAFYGCSGLTSIIVESGNMYYDSRDNCNAIIETATNTLLAGCQNTIIPNDVTSIGKWAFRDCTGLTSVTIPNSVTSIGYQAFCSCSGLTSIVIPNSVTSIGNYAFYGCKGLTSIEIGNSVTSIGNQAFYNCSGLTTVHISDLAAWCSINFGSADANPLYYAKNLYLNGEKLTELIIPDGIVEIKDYTFYNCNNLTSVVIPNSVTGIGASAFKGCNNIEKLYIGSSVESIGSKAFAGCEKINEIKVALEKPIRGSADIFADAVYDNATLYIPNGTEQLYQKREPWNLFFYIAEMDFTGIDDMEAEGERVQTIYDLQGRKVEVPSEGLYIINGKKVVVK